MNVINSQRSERLIAKRYEEQGYVVTINPPSSRIPFDVGKYRPDILATKGDENIMIEVKSAGAKVDSDTYFRIDQEAQKCPGWRFLLVTVTEAELQDQTSSSADSVNIARIQEHLAKIDKIAEVPEFAEFILPQLWTVYVTALRLFAQQDGWDVENYSDLSVLNQAYSTGIISFDEYESARRFMTVRNHMVHSLVSLRPSSDWKPFREMVGSLVARLHSPAVARP